MKIDNDQLLAIKLAIRIAGGLVPAAKIMNRAPEYVRQRKIGNRKITAGDAVLLQEATKVPARWMTGLPIEGEEELVIKIEDLRRMDL